MSQSAVSEPTKNPRTNGLLDRLADMWCRRMHDSPMLPIHGRYQCRKCHRYHDVSWEPPKDQLEPPAH